MVKGIKAHPFYQNNPNAPENAKEIKFNIENNILYQILPEVMNGRIRGNFGMHQSSIALAALVLQNEAYFNHCVDVIMATSDKQPWGVGNIEHVLVNEIDHDGCGNETSGYNGLWINGMDDIAQILKGTPQDLYKNEKFLNMHNLEIPYIVADRLSLNIGDDGGAGIPFTTIYQKLQINLFIHNGDVKSAQLLDLAAKLRKENGEDGAIVKDIFEDCEKLEQNIKYIVERLWSVSIVSEITADRSSSGKSEHETFEPKSVWMYTAEIRGTVHHDTLYLGI